MRKQGNRGVMESEDREKRGGQLKKRLRAVKKRKWASRDFECQVVVSKMRLVKVKEADER